MAQRVKVLTPKPSNRIQLPGCTWWKKRPDCCKLPSNFSLQLWPVDTRTNKHGTLKKQIDSNHAVNLEKQG